MKRLLIGLGLTSALVLGAEYKDRIAESARETYSYLVDYSTPNRPYDFVERNDTTYAIIRERFGNDTEVYPFDSTLIMPYEGLNRVIARSTGSYTPKRRWQLTKAVMHKNGLKDSELYAGYKILAPHSPLPPEEAKKIVALAGDGKER